MNWFAWFALGVLIGWLAKAAIVEWKYRMLSDYVVREIIAMRDDWKPNEKQP